MTKTDTFIDILRNMRAELATGLGTNLPDGLNSETREELTSRAEEIEEMIVGPLRDLVADLGGFVETLSAKCADVIANLEDATTASDEYDEALNAVQDYEGDDESDELADLQNDETVAENAMGDADEAVDHSRGELTKAIDTLVKHIGELTKVSE